jgi:exodeoxyribonuclease VII large subunit
MYQTEAEIVLGVSDFVAVFNQSLELSFPIVSIAGELANFRVSKNKWIYFDLKDEYASVRFFGTVYNLPGPLEDGLMLQVSGNPRLHPLYGFSLTVQNIRPVGEGSIKQAAALLEAKLQAEGLFALERKRTLPYPPDRIGLITSGESAAYADFIKVLGERWGGVVIEHIDVQVQGEVAPGQIIAAIEHFNQQATPPDALVITRGGGSADDLAAFSVEQVVRAIAGSRIPTLVAIGHEVDLSLAEMAADQRASTPSNAAELLVPDRRTIATELKHVTKQLTQYIDQQLLHERQVLGLQKESLSKLAHGYIDDARRHLDSALKLLRALSPTAILKRGYAVVRSNNAVVTAKKLKPNQSINITFHDGSADATIISKG